MTASIDVASEEAAGSAWSPGSELCNPRLDGVRGLAILLVMLYHTTHYALARGPFEEALTWIPAVGWSGVDLFFVLSGFLITGILLRARNGGHYFRAFYARRVLRIFPLYYAVLIFFFVVVPRIDLFETVHDFWQPDSTRQSLWFWLYLSNVQVALTGAWQHQALSITWSLAIEEHYYLLWPLLVYWIPERRLLWVCGVAFAGAFALRAALIAQGVDVLIPYTLTPCRIDTLATGSALAVWARRPGGMEWLTARSRRVLPAAALGFLACTVYVRLDRPSQGGESWQALTEQALAFVGHPAMQTVGFSLLCLLYGALMIWVLSSPAGTLRARLFEMAWLRSFGKYSYAMYLFHFFVGLMALNLFAPGRYPDHYVPAQLFFWTLSLGITYGLARLSWWALEDRALQLKRYFPYLDAPAGRRPTPGAGSA